MPRVRSFLLVLLLLCAGCQSRAPSSSSGDASSADAPTGRYATVRLDADVGALPDGQKKMVSLFIEAAQTMDAVFWEQAYGNRDSLLQSIADPQRRRYAVLNYGPWDRLRGGAPFIDGAGPRPPGANFYPSGLPADSLRRAAQAVEALDAPNTMVRRLPDGTLTALPYHLFFAEALTTASGRLREAAPLAPTDAQRSSLRRRAEALMTEADPVADASARPRAVRLVIGSIPTGEDRLLGVKASAVALVLRRDSARSRRLARIGDRLPALWAALSVPARFRPAAPTGDTTVYDDAAAYDALYVAGGLNAGPKPTALSLPTAGPARQPLLLANVARATADTLLRPLADAVLAEELRPHVTADAVFDVTALQQAARTALPDTASALRTAGAADALGLLLSTALAARTEGAPDTTAYYATGLTHLVHTLRVDSTTAAGHAARASLHYLREQGALSYDADTDRYAVVPDTMARALPALARAWLRPPAATTPAERHDAVPAPLRSALRRLERTGAPTALAFKQGPSVLQGLTPATAAR
ncbi:MAG: Zn-dependent hydrolase [Salinibacter sp.]